MKHKFKMYMKQYHDNLMEGTKAKLVIGAIIAAIMLLWSAVANAQMQKVEKPDVVTVGTVKSTGALIATLSYSVSNTDTLYAITYRNERYQTLADFKSIVFDNEGNAVDEFYKLLIGIVSDNAKAKGYEESVKLGKSDLTIEKTKVLGVSYVVIWDKAGRFTLNENQINKLFGKN